MARRDIHAEVTETILEQLSPGYSSVDETVGCG